MTTPDYLSLQTVELKAREQWVVEGDGLYLVFPKRGEGRLVLGTAPQPVRSGDVLV